MRCRSFAALLPLLLLVCTVDTGAQTRTITFTGIEDGGSETVILDSIRILNLTKGQDTLLIGFTTFDIDWLTGVAGSPQSPGSFRLDARVQDASAGTLALDVTMPETGRLRLVAHSLLGVEVASASFSLNPGRHVFQFTGGALASGAYIVTAQLGNEVRALKTVLLRRAAAGGARLIYSGQAAPLLRRPMTDRYTFIGYALGYHADTLASIVPEDGRTYTFSFAPLPQNFIITGPVTEAASVDIPSQGGALTVSMPGTPVTGMEITVPELSYPDTRTFTVSYADILNHGFDESITILSPLITFSNGGGYADSVMLIKIPIQLPPDHFAMAFFYNRSTDSLEGLPIVSLTDDAVYVATRHMASDHLGFAKSGSKRVAGPWIDVLVAGIRTGELTGKITTGFTPGVDDWEFINWGSYLAPGGHCTGQALTAIWYYTHKRMRGSAGLHNQMDEVHADSMWMDNVRGYRFSSVVWKELLWRPRNNWLYDHFIRIGSSKISNDSLHYLAFAFAMRTTGLPQLTEIWRKINATAWGGHAMIVYETDNGTLRIADPNYPGKQRSTSLSQGRFKPYSSGNNAGNVGVNYPYIEYIANSAITASGAVAKRWKETYDGSIGTVPPNTFPETNLYLITGSTQEVLAESIETMNDTVFVTATCPSCAYKLDDNRTPIRLTDEQGRFISWSDHDGRLRIPTKPGTARYGLTVYGWSNADGTGLGYIDFRWLTITKSSYISASVQSGPLDGHFKYVEVVSGQTYTTYSDGAVSGTSLSTGHAVGVYGRFSNNVYTHDTTYTLAGNTITASIRIVLDDARKNVTEYTITRTYLQPGDWTSTSIISGVNVPLDPVGSSESYDRFSVSTGDLCTHITKVSYVDRRLDRDGTQTLESFTCKPETKIRIALGKQ